MKRIVCINNKKKSKMMLHFKKKAYFCNREFLVCLWEDMHWRSLLEKRLILSCAEMWKFQYMKLREWKNS